MLFRSAYKLKRIAPRVEGLFWRGDRIKGLAAAPVYLFPDEDRFNSDEIEKIGIRKLTDGPLRLPHEAFIFELVCLPDRIGSQVVYIQRAGDLIEGFFWVMPRNMQKVTDVLAYATFRENMWADVDMNPRAKEDGIKYAECLTAIFWRGLAILSIAPEYTTRSVPLTRRPKLARAGVSGWTWRTVTINQDAIARAAQERRGTHASPRWHVRRGHWRKLQDGRRVFVAECEVGSPERGGVVKDYVVQSNIHATSLKGVDNV